MEFTVIFRKTFSKFFGIQIKKPNKSCLVCIRMGVKGLQHWLDENPQVDSEAEEVLENCNTLLVDGNGFGMWLLEELINAGAIRGDIGGNYKLFGTQVESYLWTLIDDYKVKPIFYFDGPRSKCKSNTLEGRRVQRSNNWTKYYLATLDNGKAKNADSSEIYEFPDLLFTELKIILSQILTFFSP